MESWRWARRSRLRCALHGAKIFTLKSVQCRKREEAIFIENNRLSQLTRLRRLSAAAGAFLLL